MKKFILLSIACLGFNATAAESNTDRYHLLSDLSFGAPVVTDVTDVNNRFQGQIVFEQSTQTFKGYSATNTWTALNVVNPVRSSSSGFKLETGALSAVCTGSCTLDSNGTTSGISSVTRSSAGTYTINFVSGTFTQAPNCTFTAIGSAPYTVTFAAVSIPAPSSSAFPITFFDFISQTQTDSQFQFICVGK